MLEKHKYIFRLEICFPRYSISTVKEFNSKNSKKAHVLAEKWMARHLAAHSVDLLGNQYVSAKLDLVF